MGIIVNEPPKTGEEFVAAWWDCEDTAYSYIVRYHAETDQFIYRDANSTWITIINEASWFKCVTFLVRDKNDD